MIFGAPEWAWPAIALGVLALGAVLWSYRRAGAGARGSGLAATLKLLGILALLFCLAEPLVRRVHARPGANQLLVVVDDSQSLTVRDRGASRTRGESMLETLSPEAAWQLRAEQDFDVQRYAFDTRMRALASVEELSFEGAGSALAATLERIAKRSAGRPVAGVLLFTDGIATDVVPAGFDWSALPPVHPVVIGRAPAADIGIERVEVTQTNFEESPVRVRVDVACNGFRGRPVAVELFDEAGVSLERQILTAQDGAAQDASFRVPAAASGVHVYRVHASLAEPSASGREEATYANNTRWAVVDRGSGPYRVLYVAGRPNWEFKFLRRALADDDELELIGLLRIARRQPKFTFRAGADRRNQLWDGFDNRDEESAEQIDEPVLLPIGNLEEFELKGGFPQAAEDLFPYHALILDDLEASFFTRDQLALIEQFVSRRGGGLMVLGGDESFAKGEYRKTPLGDLLPVYLDRLPPLTRAAGYRLDLSREGWLEPWVRLRSTEEAERERLAEMPPFQTMNRVGAIKPGGIVLLEAEHAEGTLRPALVAQRYGKGRTAAMTIGDLWRWDLARSDSEQSDLGAAWRQTARWLVSDVPRQTGLEVARMDDSREVTLRATLRDDSFDVIHNADVRIEVRPPDGEPFAIDAVPSVDEAGTWVASFVPREPGPYRASLSAAASDGSDLGRHSTGWVTEPAAEEFRTLEPNRTQLEYIASRTGGELVAPERLTSFVADLARREVPVTDEELDPLWHRWWIFLFALACFCAEWGIRRVNGLP